MKFIELFAGIGGFRYGLEKASEGYRNGFPDTREREAQRELSTKGAGSETQDSEGNIHNSESTPILQCVWANELDKYASQVYRSHYDGLYEGDIRTVDPVAIPEHDLLCGGFPCQSFSIAGKRQGFEDTRGTLFFEICRILRAKRTPYVLLENVKGLLSHDEGRTFQTIIRTLDELGYDCQWEVLNSKNFGVPQNRERVFIIGHLRGTSRPQVFPLGEADQVYPEPDGQISHAIDSNYHKGWLDNQQRTMVRTRSNQIYKESGVSTPLRQSDKGEVRVIHTSFPEETREYTDISPTISTPSGGGHLPMVAQALQTDGQLRQGTSWGTDKPQSARNIRRLTPTECARLQGFPDDWHKGLSDTQAYKCYGNAVTTTVIEAIGRQFLKGLDKFTRNEV